jgi:hypothetical protein
VILNFTCHNAHDAFVPGGVKEDGTFRGVKKCIIGEHTQGMLGNIFFHRAALDVLLDHGFCHCGGFGKL